MTPRVFGKEHLIYIAISVLVVAVGFFLNKKFARTERQKCFVLKLAAAVLFAIILVLRIVLVFEHGDPNWKLMIPDSFCSASSYGLSLAILFGKKNNNVLHFIWLVAFTGGIIVTFYPDFLGQNPSFLYPSTILGMIHHTWAAALVILMLMNGYLELTYKKWYCAPIGFSAYLSLGAFLMCVFDYANPFYMTGPSIPGTPLTVWGIAPIYMVVYALILLSVELVRKKKTKGK